MHVFLSPPPPPPPPQAQHGEYASLTEGDTPMLGILLKSGLPLLLRYSLDDSSDSLQAATLQCLHNLLVCTAEEALLEDYSDTFTGLLLPALTPSVASDATEKEEEEEERMSDEKLVELDTVKVHL